MGSWAWFLGRSHRSIQGGYLQQSYALCCLLPWALGPVTLGILGWGMTGGCTLKLGTIGNHFSLCFLQPLRHFSSKTSEKDFNKIPKLTIYNLSTNFLHLALTSPWHWRGPGAVCCVPLVEVGPFHPRHLQWHLGSEVDDAHAPCAWDRTCMTCMTCWRVGSILWG